MYNDFANTPNHSNMNSLEVAMHARAQDQKVALMVAGYRKANGNTSKAGSIRRLLSALITNLR